MLCVVDIWHSLLLKAWTDAGSPTVRVIGSDLGVAHSTVNNWLNRTATPPPAKLERLARYLCGPDEEQFEMIMAHYRTWSITVRSKRHKRQEATVVEAAPEPDGYELIAAAIREGLHEVAEAIRTRQ